MFGSETIVKDLDLNCLLFLRRNYGPFFFALDVANVCTDRTYKFELAGLMDQKKNCQHSAHDSGVSPKEKYKIEIQLENCRRIK